MVTKFPDDRIVNNFFRILTPQPTGTSKLHDVPFQDETRATKGYENKDDVDSDFIDFSDDEEYLPKNIKDPTKQWQGFHEKSKFGDYKEHVQSSSEDTSELDSGNSSSTDDELVWRVKKKSYPQFNPNVDMDDLTFKLRMIFSTRESFKKVVIEYGI
ncbi:hypothetical protein TorRG33x02_056270 [Trema orientale]|uniref:Uncharacterized protein n=1 Tax=Trema orientale TaxID=63057 RepID=A0A2P5FKV1_TREOI|nr:hypothetical protein TorRG33x02_056270 [Trema orientale]